MAACPQEWGCEVIGWCRHDGEARTDNNACHGDVLVHLLEAYTDDELRTMAWALEDTDG